MEDDESSVFAFGLGPSRGERASLLDAGTESQTEQVSRPPVIRIGGTIEVSQTSIAAAARLGITESEQRTRTVAPPLSDAPEPRMFVFPPSSATQRKGGRGGLQAEEWLSDAQATALREYCDPGTPNVAKHGGLPIVDAARIVAMPAATAGAVDDRADFEGQGQLPPGNKQGSQALTLRSPGLSRGKTATRVRFADGHGKASGGSSSSHGFLLLQSVLASRFPGVLVADGGSPGDGLPGHGVAGTRILGTEREQLIGSARFGLGGDRNGRDVGSLLLLAPGGGWLRPRIATRPSVGTKREVFGANAQPGLEAQRRKWRRVLAAAGRPDPVVMRGIGVLPSVTGHLNAGGADLAGTIRAGQQASSNEDGAADLALTAAKAVATRAGAGAGRPSFGFAGEAPPADDLDGDWPCERISPRPVGLAPPLADSCPLHNSNAASRLQPLSASSTVTVVTAVSQHSAGASLEAIIGLSVAA